MYYTGPAEAFRWLGRKHLVQVAGNPERYYVSKCLERRRQTIIVRIIQKAKNHLSWFSCLEKDVAELLISGSRNIRIKKRKDQSSVGGDASSWRILSIEEQ